MATTLLSEGMPLESVRAFLGHQALRRAKDEPR